MSTEAGVGGEDNGGRGGRKNRKDDGTHRFGNRGHNDREKDQNTQPLGRQIK